MMNESRRIRWAGNVAHMEDIRNAYKILVRKPEGKRPLGRPKNRKFFSRGSYGNLVLGED
jgi:hypothetical protein